MPNIFDYLEWRGDLPLDADPFNDVDNLILSELTYTHFDGIVPENGECIPVSRVCEEYFASRSRDKIRRSDNTLAKTCLLMDGMISGDRFREVQLSDYVNIVDADRNMQMAAVTYHLNDGTVYIAFRGTDNTVVGWKEDFVMSYLPETDGQRAALNYLERVAGRLNCPVRVGGHSKGGNFAVYASSFCSAAVQDKIIRVYTNDGPGFRHEVMESEGYKRILPKVSSIIPESSMIGTLLANEAEDLVVMSSARLMAQHDGMTWQVHRNTFIQEESSDLSRVFEETIRDWLSKIDDKQRESFVNALFSVLEATGAGTFREMKANRIRTIESIASSAQDLPRDKQQLIMNIAGELLQSGGRKVRKALEDNYRERMDQNNQDSDK